MNVITSTTIAPTATQQLSAPVKPFIQMSSGMAGGISNAQRAPEPPNIPSLPLVSSAVAAMAAYAAYELERKREEELARQAAEEEHKAEMRAEAYARAEAGWDRASAKKKAEQVHTSNVYAQLRAQAAEKEHAAQVYTQLRAQAAEKERQKANEDFRRGERAPETVTVPQNKSWLQKAWDNTRNFGQKAATAVTTVTQSIMASIPKPGGPKVLAEPMPTKYQTGNKDDGCGLNIFCWLKKWFGCGSTPPAPTPDISAIYTQVAQTAFAQYTQMAQVLVTPLAISTPVPPSTPVSLKIPMIVSSDGLNLRLQPVTATDAPLKVIPKGGIVLVDPNSVPVISEGYCWRQVTYKDPTINVKAIAASPDFLNPLSDFNRITAQGDSITYNNAVPGWAGKHIGNDFVPALGSDANPPVFASASGITIRAGSEMAGYGNYVIIEYPDGSLPIPIHNLPEYKPNDSLYAIYAHLKENMSNILTPGTIVKPGMQIGTMGDSGNTGGLVHLHLELRLGEAATDSNGLKNLNANNGEWYNAGSLPPLDPALIFTPKDTWNGWAAQSQWSTQAQCATGESYFNVP